ncbi:hypothetical protein [Brevibacillus gelatini]
MDDQTVVLMLPVIKEENAEATFYPSTGIDEAVEMLPVSYEAIAGFAKSFTDFELDNIEVHIKGVAKSGGITQLIVGLEGEAGVKITLTKKR